MMASYPAASPLTYAAALILMPQVKPGTTSGAFTLELPKDIRETMVTIFGDPVKTQVNLLQNGIRAVLPAPTPPNTKIAEMAIPKVFAKTPLTTDTAHAMATLFNKCIKDGKILKNLSIIAFGLNFEVEITIPSVDDSGRWIAQRFLKNHLNLPSPWSVARGELSFAITHPEGWQRNIVLQPRADQPKAFFAMINNHFPTPPSFPLGDEAAWGTALNDHFAKSKDFILGLLEPTEKSP